MGNLNMGAEPPGDPGSVPQDAFALAIPPDRNQQPAKQRHALPLEQPGDHAVLIDPNRLGCRNPWQAWHGHDVAANGDNKTRPCG